MSQQHCHFDASRSLTALEQDSTIIAVIEMSQSKWLIAALVPGLSAIPLRSSMLKRRVCSSFYIVGAMKPARLGARSGALSSLMRLAETASGWRDGCGLAMSKPMSFIPRRGIA